MLTYLLGCALSCACFLIFFKKLSGDKCTNEDLLALIVGSLLSWIGVFVMVFIGLMFLVEKIPAINSFKTFKLTKLLNKVLDLE